MNSTSDCTIPFGLIGAGFAPVLKSCLDVVHEMWMRNGTGKFLRVEVLGNAKYDAPWSFSDSIATFKYMKIYFTL